MADQNQKKKKKEALLNVAAINYVNPSFPLAFTSASALIDFYRPWLTARELTASLQRVPAYAMKSVRRRRQTLYNPTLVWQAHRHFQGDLIDLGMLASANRNVHYLLVIIDGFTREAAALPLRTKKSEEVAHALEHWLQEELLPKLGVATRRATRGSSSSSRRGTESRAKKPLQGVLWHCDRGLEFLGRPFRQVLSAYGLEMTHPAPGRHAYIIERWNQTFKRMLFRFLKSKDNNAYLLQLPTLVRHYNEKKHRMLGMSPSEACLPKNYRDVLQKRLEYVGGLALAGSGVPQLKEGTLVRIIKEAQPFDKGYKDALSAKLFVVSAVKTNLPVPMYRLSAWEEEEEEERGGVKKPGLFYREQLMPAAVGRVRLPPHRIVRRRTVTVPHAPPLTGPSAPQTASWRELFLSWNGLPEKFNVFMPSSLYDYLKRKDGEEEEEGGEEEEKEEKEEEEEEHEEHEHGDIGADMDDDDD